MCALPTYLSKQVLIYILIRCGCVARYKFLCSLLGRYDVKDSVAVVA